MRAKALLTQKNIPFTEYTIDGDDAAREQMAERANGKRSLPQIFIDNNSIGGCDELYALEQDGKLDAMVSS
jgi:glutaredoxin 3